MKGVDDNSFAFATNNTTNSHSHLTGSMPTGNDSYFYYTDAVR